ncbi:MAG: carboxypeptidase M32 [Chlamydiia bacterium]|nr:carboxypeptidase M32 [Chlamydiia bacterium]MCP5508958.1 carboxypeptidase M32 [Chlamydiales bacterium]
MPHPQFKATLNAALPGRILHSIEGLLSWDQETHMPKGAIGARSVQKEYIAGLCHKEQTSLKFERALSKLIDLDSGNILIEELSPAEKAAAREWRRDFLKNHKLPGRFVERFCKVCSEATHAWSAAKDNDDFNSFEPHLTTIMEMAKERADHLGYKNHPYDALLDEYEPDATSAQIDPLFTELKPFLIDLTKQVSKPAPDLPVGPYPATMQTKFTTDLLFDMGLDPHHTRLDVSSHPFCMDIHPTDLRLTTHIYEDSPIQNISAVLHEGGHGLYETGLPAEFYGSPLSEAISLGIHESQSRFWEVLIGQSLPFWQYYYPKLQKLFPKLQTFTLDDYYAHLNRVQPSFIRVHADEVTYTLHVILRYELEKELLSGKLKAKDIPAAWNAKMQDFLGITPPNNAKGCLQDVHWSCGLIGYFPTYALGNLYSAQFFATFVKAHPDYASRIACGDLKFIRAWLLEQIHCHGRRYSAAELVQNVTGTPLTAKAYKNYLENKYTKGL